VYSPYSNLGQLNTPEITFLGTMPDTQWPCFFEWRISTPSCATERRPIQLDVPPTPPIEMAADTATCQLTNIVLDPLGNDPLYTYLWNDGSTADTLTVNSSGYYKVTVTNDGLCAASKDILVQFLTMPTGQFNNDTTICSSGLIDFAQMSTDGIVVWYDSANLSTIQSLSAPYSVYVQNDTSFWMDVAPRAVTRLGNQQFSNPDQSNFYTSTTTEFRFDVFEYAVLDSVAMYAETAPATYTINLEDSAGNILFSKTHTILEARQKVFIPLNFILAPGVNYDLTLASPAPAYLANNIILTDNNSNAGIANLKGGYISTTINFTPFYDWHFSYAHPDCHAAADTFSVAVNIPIDLPDSLYTCDSILIDAFDANISNYNWSTGETTAQVTLSSAGLYTLSFTDGVACNITDTVQLYTPVPVIFPNSIAVCDSLLFSNYLANEASFVWSTGDTTVATRIPGIGAYTLTVTTNGGCALTGTASITQLIAPPAPNLGSDTSICVTTTLDAGFSNQGYTYSWSNGATSQQIVANTTSFYSVTVTSPLGCSGNDITNVYVAGPPSAGFLAQVQNPQTYSVSITPLPYTSYISPATEFWDFGPNAMPTSSTASFPTTSYADSGCYRIRHIVNDPCGVDTFDLWLPVEVDSAGCPLITASTPYLVSNTNLFDFIIMPNPNNGQFSVALSGLLEEDSYLIIYDLNGRAIYQQNIPKTYANSWSVERRGMAAGVYFVRLVNSKQSKTVRMIIYED
jgi:hypothetical protein